MSGTDLVELRAVRQRHAKNADDLRKVSKRLHGYEVDGEKFMGVKLQYEEALDEALLRIVDKYEAEGKRPPAEDIRNARARQMVKTEQPDLYDEFHMLDALHNRIKRWLGDTRSTIMAGQTIIKTERELAGQPGGYE